MKTILYLAQTINGMLADGRGQSPWSDATFEAYHNEVNISKNVVIGTDTYRVMKKYDDFADFDDDVRVIIVSARGLEPDIRLNTTVVESPEVALELLESEGYERAHIAGGAVLATHMFERDQIDELWLDIEPQLFGSGLNLINSGVSESMSVQLTFMESKLVSDDVIQLRYRVTTPDQK